MAVGPRSSSKCQGVGILVLWDLNLSLIMILNCLFILLFGDGWVLKLVLARL